MFTLSGPRFALSGPKYASDIAGVDLSSWAPLSISQSFFFFFFYPTSSSVGLGTQLGGKRRGGEGAYRTGLKGGGTVHTGQLHRLRTSQAYLVSGVLYKWSRWPLASTQMVEERAYAAAAGTASLRIGAPLSKRPTLPGIGAKRQRSPRSHQLLSSSTPPLKLPRRGSWWTPAAKEGRSRMLDTSSWGDRLDPRLNRVWRRPVPRTQTGGCPPLAHTIIPATWGDSGGEKETKTFPFGGDTPNYIVFMPKQGRLTGVNNWRREFEPQIKVSKASISGDAG